MMAGTDILSISITAFLFLLSFISGALLSRLNKTRNLPLLSAHKLLSLATAVSTALTIYRLAGIH